jgi:pseudaminic acid biosynthesis-associated methylase
VVSVSRRETPQLRQWTGRFGLDYTDRNSLTPAQVDELWMKNYGVSRSEMNRKFLSDVPKDARILEVGCNLGNQLVLLQNLGYTNLYGVEVQEYAIEAARARTRNIQLALASAFDLPYEDGYFDLVFTAGVLIHISPQDLPVAMDEIHRCSKEYLMGSEYYAPRVTEVKYRNHDALLWKMDYAQQYLTRFPGLGLIREERLPYLENPNVDSMFLLRKVR